ncbi:N-acyl homoserine lactonase family protein [Bosea psychrotolerans]|uniref:Glyoxylase-like metal-dependent hydrolase (Beta-lactamase superfamily II) n=1 Tax=Bosea psychrotolerans TaxID=1871628 RepID=A0A2S4M8A1_9HYPH|nr:N-acyl homoserine lactonase family protein [Bosea psychrotolerans]POR50968.1 glyoxylase-like metal-dependent hydrolase (beta-lactamase superfamily II) [Bosea psychrotolerans]
MRLWDVYALRYAVHERTALENFLRPPDPHDVPMSMDYFVWVLRSQGRAIVVDTGFTPEGGAKRKRELIRPVEAALRQLGVEPGDVGDVVITHLHYDHAGNLDLFPKAMFHLQDAEMSFATGRHMCQACLRYPFEVEDVVRMVRAVYAERVEFHDGDAEIAEGVTLHKVGGHSAGLQMVRVETARGPVVLASDAAHFYANMERQNPFPIYYDLGALAQGWRAAKRLAGAEERVIPGHDPLVRLNYPAHPGSDGETAILHLDPVT